MPIWDMHAAALSKTGVDIGILWKGKLLIRAFPAKRGHIICVRLNYNSSREPGPFTSFRHVKIPDLRLSLRSKLRPGTRVE